MISYSESQMLSENLTNYRDQLQKETKAKAAREEAERTRRLLEKARNFAAIKLQAMTRGFLVRSSVRKAKEASKKKKGKSKKAKK
jgi:uncharacterized membrane protein